MECHALEAHVLADEVAELVGAYLSQALEARDLGVGRELADGLLALLLAVAVEGDEVALGVGVGEVLLVEALDALLLVTHAEEGGLEDVHVPFLDEVGEEL